MPERYRPRLAATVLEHSMLLQKLGSPVLKNEDKTVYDELFNTVWADVRPKDIIEQIWVRDIVDETWEIFRWRRLATTIVPSMFGCVKKISTTMVRDNYGTCVDHPTSFQEFSEFAQRAQRVDRLISNAVQRRNSTLREIERRRFLFAQRLRKSLDQAEVRVVEPNLSKIEGK
jgi:hypothetical protein